MAEETTLTAQTNTEAGKPTETTTTTTSSTATTSEQQTQQSQQTQQTQQPVVPEKYELKLSEKSALAASDIEKIATYAKSQKLTQEQAAQLLKHQEELAGGMVQRQQSQRQSETQAWVEQVKADKELGGDHFATTIKNCGVVMDKFAPGADHEFRKLLDETGYGNHPVWIRFVNTIGKAMAEDKPLGTGQAVERPKTLAERMYPNLK